MSEEAKRLKEIQAELEKVLNAKRTARLLDVETLKSYEDTFEALKKTNKEAKAFETQLKNIQKEIAENERAIYGISGAFSEAVDELNGMNAGLNRAK